MVPRDEIEAVLAVTNLLAQYADCIDSEALEQWPDMFTERCVYKITTAENQARGLPIGIVYADSRAMLKDRIAALRDANIYEPQRYRHIISAVCITGRDGATVGARSNFMVVRTMADGTQDLFVTGCYIDLVDFAGDRPRFTEKLVVLDSDKIDTLLAIPL